MKKSLNSPCVFFEFTNITTKTRQHILFRDLIRFKRADFKASPELISIVLSRLYERVDPKYFALAIFGI